MFDKRFSQHTVLFVFTIAIEVTLTMDTFTFKLVETDLDFLLSKYDVQYAKHLMKDD